MKILFCSSEVVPFAKTGGLADVAGALPAALEGQGHEVRIALPKYGCIKNESDLASAGKNIKVHFIRNDKYFMREGLYGTARGDYPDNLDRFAFYCRRTLELLKEEGFKPDVIHCNDWQTGLIPVYLKALYMNEQFYKNIKTVFTIHNLAYTGAFPKEEFAKTGLSRSLFTIDGLEYYGRFSLLKGGLIFSDALTTVSATYAREIQTEEFGCGMEGILKKRSSSLYGILNGIDYSLWDPKKDKNLYMNYSPESIDGKYLNKERLIKEAGLKISGDMPLIGTVGRLAHQKGYDILADALDELCCMDTGIILLGTGEERYHKAFKSVMAKHRDKASINLYFDMGLAQKIYAASDIFLMPSRYEPCGLGQLISFKYATVPVARETGGLADTISEFDPETEEGNGFLFKDADPRELLKALKRAIAVYANKRMWRRLITKIAGYDFSWDKSAKEYSKIYESLGK